MVFATRVHHSHGLRFLQLSTVFGRSLQRMAASSTARDGLMTSDAAQFDAGSVPPRLDSSRTLSISESNDDATIRATYRPFLLPHGTNGPDWIDDLELDAVSRMSSEDYQRTGQRLKVLVLFGSLRPRFVRADPGQPLLPPRFRWKG